MNILLTTHQMADFAGSEIYTFELAKGLTRAGHTVVVYSRYVHKFEYLFAREAIELVTDLASVSDRHFDVAHVHHHINALEVRLYFPELPIFFLSHGATTFLEKPPGIDINITQYGAVSELVAKSLITAGVKKSVISIVNNIVDDQLFCSRTPIHQKPQRALIISNRMDKKTMRTIRKACQKLGIQVTGVGSVFKRVDNFDMPKVINEADIVFTIGRGVIETMLCGRIPVVFDRKGGDGLLTTKNFNRSAQYHFNGFYKKKSFTATALVKELRAYDAEQGSKLQAMAKRLYGTSTCIADLETIYTKTIEEYSHKKINRELLQYIVQTVHVTRLHTFSRSENRGRLAKIKYLVEDMPRIIKSKWSAITFPAFPTVGLRALLHVR